VQVAIFSGRLDAAYPLSACMKPPYLGDAKFAPVRKLLLKRIDSDLGRFANLVFVLE
jgi:hypothetical protein